MFAFIQKLFTKRQKKFFIQMEEEWSHLTPTKAHPSDAGYDLYAAIEDPLVIPAGEVRTISVGFRCALPEGYEMQIRSRSGLASKNYISVLNSPGTIDSNYRGVVGVILMNHGKYDYTLQPGERIAQAIVTKLPNIDYVLIDELDMTDRGEAGFGSTGK